MIKTTELGVRPVKKTEAWNLQNNSEKFDLLGLLSKAANQCFNC